MIFHSMWLPSAYWLLCVWFCKVTTYMWYVHVHTNDEWMHVWMKWCVFFTYTYIRVSTYMINKYTIYSYRSHIYVYTHTHTYKKTLKYATTQWVSDYDVSYTNFPFHIRLNSNWINVCNTHTQIVYQRNIVVTYTITHTWCSSIFFVY